MSQGPQRVCILANTFLRRWEVEALERMLDETDVEVSHVVIYDPSRDDEWDQAAQWNTQSRVLERGGGLLGDISLFFDILPHERGWTLVLAERKIAERLGLSVEQRMTESTAIEDVECLDGVERIRTDAIPTRGGELPRQSVSGVWKRLPDEIVDRVCEECDVVVRFGFGLIEGRILEEPEYGVLSFHASDIRNYRGLSTTERFLDGATEAGATLQQLTEDVDGGRIVAEGTVDLTGAHSWEAQRERIYRMQRDLLADGIENLSDPDFEPESPTDLPPAVPLRRKQDWSYAARIVARQLSARFRLVGKKLINSLPGGRSRTQ